MINRRINDEIRYYFGVELNNSDIIDAIDNSDRYKKLFQESQDHNTHLKDYLEDKSKHCESVYKLLYAEQASHIKSKKKAKIKFMKMKLKLLEENLILKAKLYDKNEADKIMQYHEYAEFYKIREIAK